MRLAKLPFFLLSYNCDISQFRIFESFNYFILFFGRNKLPVYYWKFRFCYFASLKCIPTNILWLMTKKYRYVWIGLLFSRQYLLRDLAFYTGATAVMQHRLSSEPPFCEFKCKTLLKNIQFYQHHYLLLTSFLGLVTVTLCHGLWSQTRLKSISRLLKVIITSITSWHVTFNITVNLPELHDSERLLCYCNKYLSVWNPRGFHSSRDLMELSVVSLK